MSEIAGTNRFRQVGAPGSTRWFVVALMLVLLAGCGAWQGAEPDGSGTSGPSSRSSPSSSALTPGEPDTPVLALRRLYEVADTLEAHPQLSTKTLDVVAVGSARRTLASAVHRRRSAQATDRGHTTTLTQIVVRPAERSGQVVTAVVQFCASRQIEAMSNERGEVLRPSTITFRYESGRWRAFVFGFAGPDCGCSQPIQCG